MSDGVDLVHDPVGRADRGGRAVEVDFVSRTEGLRDAAESAPFRP